MAFHCLAHSLSLGRYRGFVAVVHAPALGGYRQADCHGEAVLRGFVEVAPGGFDAPCADGVSSAFGEGAEVHADYAGALDDVGLAAAQELKAVALGDYLDFDGCCVGQRHG